MNYVGIDIAKRLHVAAVVDATGKVVGPPFPFANDEDGFESLLAWLSGLGIGCEGTLVAMESTAHYWVPLWAWLDRRGFGQAVVNPILTEAYRKAHTVRRTKTDSADAVTIADFARFQGLCPQRVSPEEVEGLRSLTRYRAELVRQRTALKNRAAALTDRLFPELPGLFNSSVCATLRAVLTQLGSASRVASTDIRRISRVVSEASGGRYGREKAEEIKAAARRSVAPGWAEEALCFEVASVLALVEFMDRRIADVEAKVAEVADAELYGLLQTIPGVGPVNAATIMAEIGDPERFPDPKKLFAYSGMDASVSDSGESVGRGGRHMTKRGSAYLRFALMTSADAARRADPYFGDYYDAMKARGKHHYVAVSGVARKLCGVVLAVMKERRPYERRPSVQSVEAGTAT